MDNHDVTRFLFDKPSPAALQNALAFLLTEDGIPCIYYGTEQEFAGGNDPTNRERLWDTGFRTDGGTFQWIQKLIKIRKTYCAAAARRDDHEVRDDARGDGRGRRHGRVRARRRRARRCWSSSTPATPSSRRRRNRRWAEPTC